MPDVPLIRNPKAFVADAASCLGFNIVQQLSARGVPVRALVQDPSNEVLNTKALMLHNHDGRLQYRNIANTPSPLNDIALVTATALTLYNSLTTMFLPNP